LGIVRSLPIDVYHADRSAISNSGLNDIARSPEHFHALHLDPNRPPPEDKRSHVDGNLMHCAALEPAEFDKRYKVGPINDKRLVEWKEFARSMAKHVGEGVTLITPDQRDVAFAQAASIRSLPDVAALMGDGQAEVSAYWIDATTGVRCRCRPDWRSPTGKRGKQSILLDMKGYGDVSAREFALQVARMSYARQAAMYSIGYEIASGHPVVGFVFVAVEDRFPFAAAAYMLPEEWLEIGRREYRELLDLYAKCLATNTWPRLQDGIQLLQMPAWVAREAEKV
jgi:hypothetical protein